jgi:glycosyltransferase involved in cell wall biosynthesis
MKQGANQPNTCIIVVGRNEEETIGTVIENVKTALDGNPHFIVVIDDGSTDRTAAVARKHADHTISREPYGLGYSMRQGYQFALTKGFKVIINIDADGQHDPRVLPKVIQHLQNGTSIVKGTRFHPDSQVVGEIPEDRLHMNRHFAKIISQLTGHQITDALCGLYGFKQYALKRLLPHLKSVGYGLCLEILIKRKYLIPDCIPFEIAHPAIYLQDTARHAIKYSDKGLAERKRRFDDHIEHVKTSLAYCSRMGWIPNSSNHAVIPLCEKATTA